MLGDSRHEVHKNKLVKVMSHASDSLHTGKDNSTARGNYLLSHHTVVAENATLRTWPLAEALMHGPSAVAAQLIVDRHRHPQLGIPFTERRQIYFLASPIALAASRRLLRR